MLLLANFFKRAIICIYTWTLLVFCFSCVSSSPLLSTDLLWKLLAGLLLLLLLGWPAYLSPVYSSASSEYQPRPSTQTARLSVNLCGERLLRPLFLWTWLLVKCIILTCSFCFLLQFLCQPVTRSSFNLHLPAPFLFLSSLEDLPLSLSSHCFYCTYLPAAINPLKLSLALAALPLYVVMSLPCYVVTHMFL